MTLHERLEKTKAEATELAQAHQRVRAQGLQIEQAMIRADAEMALLEALIKESEQATLLTLVKPEADHG